MANSKVTLTFASVPSANTHIIIAEEFLGLEMSETMKVSRNASFQVKIPSAFLNEEDVPIYNGYISNFFKTAFDLDYNSSGLFTVTSVPGDSGTGLGTVIIEANYPGAMFTEIENTVSGLFVEIDNAEPEDLFTIDGISFSEADTSKCSKVKVSVQTSAQAAKITSPLIVDPVEENPVSFDWPRGLTITIQAEDSGGQTASQTVTLPPMLVSDDFPLNLNNSPNGATLVVSNNASSLLEVEYSLDDDAYQQGNTFPGLTPGEYTLYVRDQFGCRVEIDFTVNEAGTLTPYFYISKSNPIRYAQRIEWGVSSNYKTPENTLSFEAEVKEVKMEVQQFNADDVIPTQFLSNYPSHEIRVIDKQGNETPISAVQKSQFIGNKDKRDAISYDLGNGKTGIYFLSGNTYDFDTGAETGTYSLNGFVPVWADAGNYLVMGTSWFIIEEKIFDDEKNAEVIVISSVYEGETSETPVIVGCIFNMQPYEVYEFDVEMIGFLGKVIKVSIRAYGDGMAETRYLSEWISVENSHANTKSIRYWNDSVTDVYYTTGIRFLRRMELLKRSAFPDESSDTYKTDSRAVLISDTVFEGDEFKFEPVTEEIMRSLVLALGHENVFIDDVGYTKSENTEVEGPLDDSNLYVVTARMLKSGRVYNSVGFDGDQPYNGGSLEVPTLVDHGGGFVRA